MKCLICGKPADSRKLCRGHYVAAKRMKVLDKFPRLVRSSGVMESEVQAYLAKRGNGGLATMQAVPGFAECTEHHLRFKRLQDLKHHITSIHLKGATP